MHFSVVCGLLLILCGQCSSVKPCSCEKRPLQNVYCEADFVAQVYIEGTDFLAGSGKYLYQIKILQTLRAGPSFAEAEQDRMWSGGRGDTCVVSHLVVGRIYLVTGNVNDGTLTIDSCGWIEPWDLLTSHQLRAVQTLWHRQCNRCQIVFCDGKEQCQTDGYGRVPRTKCLLNTALDARHCFDMYTVCERKKQRCEFKHTSALDYCLKTYSPN